MNGMKTFGTVLAVALMIFVIAPIASAQQYAGILDGQWFKVNLSLKGYQIGTDGETVLGKRAGSVHAYLYMSYDTNNLEYTITTCMQDDVTDNIWYKRTSAAPISIANIYGATYPQVWEFDANYLQFYNGGDTFNVYPTFYTKITADGGTLKNATISNVACALYADLAGGEYGTGSCILNGSLVLEAKVPAKVPAACQ
jgi:hypothetical protein